MVSFKAVWRALTWALSEPGGARSTAKGATGDGEGVTVGVAMTRLTVGLAIDVAGDSVEGITVVQAANQLTRQIARLIKMICLKDCFKFAFSARVVGDIVL